MIYKKDSLTSCLWEGTLYDMLKSAIRGHWDKIILDKSRASAHTGVGIPRLNGNAYRNASKKLGGLPHQ